MSQLTAAPRQQMPPAHRRRRWLFWLGGPCLLFGLWLVLAVLFFLYQTDRDLREAMAEAERDSPGGWQLSDIEAQREPVPDEDNSALVVLKVKSLLPASWGAATESLHARLVDLPPEVQLDESLRDELRCRLAEVEAARVEAGKLIGMTRGRFPIDWDEVVVFNTRLHSQEARAAANLLRYEAALASQDGQADAALADVRGLVATARSIGDEHVLISAMIRLACDSQAVDALERALAQGEPSATELEALQSFLEQEAAEPLLLRALRGERAGLHRMLLALRSRDATLAQIDPNSIGRSTGIERTLLEASGPTLARRAHPRILRLLNEYVQAAQLPLGQQEAALNRLHRKLLQARAEYDIVTALLMPAFQKVAEAFRRGVGNLRCASVALALERYRRDHARWPVSLAALVPKYLSAVPADPQDGNPLRFRRRPDGVVVYWVGMDGTDDGGKLNRRDYLTKGFDQGVQLWNGDQRRQPALERLPRPREAP